MLNYIGILFQLQDLDHIVAHYGRHPLPLNLTSTSPAIGDLVTFDLHSFFTSYSTFLLFSGCNSIPAKLFIIKAHINTCHILEPYLLKN